MKSGFKNKLNLLIVFLFFLIHQGIAQCAMCKAQAEQSIEQGSTTAKWINGGILYMLVIPYLAIGILFWKWYQSYKSEKKY